MEGSGYAGKYKAGAAPLLVCRGGKPAGAFGLLITRPLHASAWCSPAGDEVVEGGPAAAAAAGWRGRQQQVTSRANTTQNLAAIQAAMSRARSHATPALYLAATIQVVSYWRCSPVELGFCGVQGLLARTAARESEGWHRWGGQQRLGREVYGSVRWGDRESTHMVPALGSPNKHAVLGVELVVLARPRPLGALVAEHLVLLHAKRAGDNAVRSAGGNYQSAFHTQSRSAAAPAVHSPQRSASGATPAAEPGSRFR